jgi:hypothetical protein
MNLVKNNPYRIVGILVGVTAKEQDRQIKRLKQYLSAEQEPPEELLQYEFSCLGSLKRTEESVVEASSKLNLDNDRLNAALFWFFNGNSITDEPAFEALKDSDIQGARVIWSKLTNSYEISQRNFSAFHNLSTLLLCESMNGTTINHNHFEAGLKLKLKLLDSNFVEDFKSKATDETFKKTKKEIQLSFLSSLQRDILKYNEFSLNELLDIISKQNFAAKDDFLNGAIQDIIKLIEIKIQETKIKRKNNPVDAERYGNDLYNEIQDDLAILTDLLDYENISYQTICDKVANEILQCGIDFFKRLKDDEYDPSPESMDLFEIADNIACGSIVQQRIQENIDQLQLWIDDKPERDKQNKIKEELEFIATKLERFQSLTSSIANAKDLLNSCKLHILKIQWVLGNTDELYLNLSSAIVHHAQNMVIQAVNVKLEENKNKPFIGFGFPMVELDNIISSALDVTFKMGTYDMHGSLKEHYNKNLEDLKSLARQLHISTLSPKEKLQTELRNAENRLKEIQNTTFYNSELAIANNELHKIQEWQFLRSKSDRDHQINTQQKKINSIKQMSEEEKRKQVTHQQSIIMNLKTKIQNTEY